VTQVRLRILGECIIEIGDSTLEPSATHLFALTLYLAIERGKLVSRSLLAGLLFPGAAFPSPHTISGNSYTGCARKVRRSSAQQHP